LDFFSPLPNAKQQLNALLGPGASVLNNPATDAAQRFGTDAAQRFGATLSPLTAPVTDTAERLGSELEARAIFTLLSLINLNLFALFIYGAVAIAVISITLILIF